MNQRYDLSGAATRLIAGRTRIARQIVEALGDAAKVVNVGAGTGSYVAGSSRSTAQPQSPRDGAVRPPDVPPVMRAAAEQLPFADRALDESLAILTVHHWRNQQRGLAEMRRMAWRRVVILTWDIAKGARFWLTARYSPENHGFRFRSIRPGR
jgi:SAM-dependent methyltransferase